MTITAAIVLFSITWFMVFFCVLPLRFVSQADAGSVVPGTPRSAPAGDVVVRKAKITSVVAILVWAALYLIIVSGWISVRDIDVMHVMPPERAAGG
jgi:predicted secreted protein